MSLDRQRGCSAPARVDPESSSRLHRENAAHHRPRFSLGTPLAEYHGFARRSLEGDGRARYRTLGLDAERGSQGGTRALPRLRLAVGQDESRAVPHNEIRIAYPCYEKPQWPAVVRAFPFRTVASIVSRRSSLGHVREVYETGMGWDPFVRAQGSIVRRH